MRLIRFGVEVLRSAAMLAVIEFNLRTGDLTTTCARLRLRLDVRSATPPARVRAVLPRRTRAGVVAARLVVAGWPFGDTCLRRCLLIGHRLGELDPVLRIGVRRGPDGVFAAHSWLEIDGTTLDPTAERYAALGSARQVG